LHLHADVSCGWLDYYYESTTRHCSPRLEQLLGYAIAALSRRL
jgi:hypothetical protein